MIVMRSLSLDFMDLMTLTLKMKSSGYDYTVDNNKMFWNSEEKRILSKVQDAK